MKQVTVPYVKWTGDVDALPMQLEHSGKRISVDTLNWEREYPYAPMCIVTLGYCERGLLLHYYVRGLDLRTLSPGDGHYVHEDSCVEFFMQSSVGEAYINFEFNAAGVCYASHHSSPSEGVRFTQEEFATILRWATYQGQQLDESDLVHEWELSAMIPWTTMGYSAGEVPTHMRANFYKCADGTRHPHYLSWAPIDEPTPAFHRPQFFGELIFAR